MCGVSESKGVCGSRVCSDLGGSRGVGCKGYLGSRSIWKYGVPRSKGYMRYKGYQGFRVCSGLLGLGVFGV